MVEKPRWNRGAIKASKEFEKAWRIYTHPDNRTAEEYRWAQKFFTFQIENYRTAISLGGTDEVPAEILDEVFMGIYHKHIEPPAELKYHPNSN